MDSPYKYVGSFLSTGLNKDVLLHEFIKFTNKIQNMQRQLINHVINTNKKSKRNLDAQEIKQKLSEKGLNCIEGEVIYVAASVDILEFRDPHSADITPIPISSIKDARQIQYRNASNSILAIAEWQEDSGKFEWHLIRAPASYCTQIEETLRKGIEEFSNKASELRDKTAATLTRSTLTNSAEKRKGVSRGSLRKNARASSNKEKNNTNDEDDDGVFGFGDLVNDLDKALSAEWDPDDEEFGFGFGNNDGDYDQATIPQAVLDTIARTQQGSRPNSHPSSRPGSRPGSRPSSPTENSNSNKKGHTYAIPLPVDELRLPQNVRVPSPRSLSPLEGSSPRMSPRSNNSPNSTLPRDFSKSSTLPPGRSSAVEFHQTGANNSPATMARSRLTTMETSTERMNVLPHFVVKLSKVQAETMIIEKEKELGVGTFLVRNSESSEGDYTLSFMNYDKVTHMRISKLTKPTGAILFTLPAAADAGGPWFKSLSSMVSHYQQNSIPGTFNSRGAIIKLGKSSAPMKGRTLKQS
eukprot:m.131799 g.131799  ORF g.131799 m.131799 type:complete len:524 (+) comp29566_c0_seq6:625-2196(+)